MRTLVLFLLVGLARCGIVAAAWPVSDDLVNIKEVDPTILVELRYATARNSIHQALYPDDAKALVRPSVADRLVRAQQFLREHHYGLKIWDAWRPQFAQIRLWEATHNGSYVADPAAGNGSLHGWGVAVDVTLVDQQGREMQMPTDFDEFTPAAMLHYKGENELVKWNLRMLQVAMRRAGFYGMRTEWWHFVAYDWKKYAPISGPR